ncbi:density-regulated protein-like [Argopecten irradians]|uniref:density-regulated protein-like n=1 Tax=Argopecten irradians TaxID=31199 RepID=UPI0037129A8C
MATAEPEGSVVVPAPAAEGRQYLVYEGPRSDISYPLKVLYCGGVRARSTVITGLSTYEIDLKEASRFFSQKFSCGSSVISEDEISIQGDKRDDLFDILCEKWPQIDEDDIDDIGEVKK